jgi:hypothetical protein
MAQAMLHYVSNGTACRRQGEEGRSTAERDFSMAAMVSGYMAVYDGMLQGKRSGKSA